MHAYTILDSVGGWELRPGNGRKVNILGMECVVSLGKLRYLSVKGILTSIVCMYLISIAEVINNGYCLRFINGNYWFYMKLFGIKSCLTFNKQ